MSVPNADICRGFPSYQLSARVVRFPFQPVARKSKFTVVHTVSECILRNFTSFSLERLNLGALIVLARAVTLQIPFHLLKVGLKPVLILVIFGIVAFLDSGHLVHLTIQRVLYTLTV